MTVKKKTSKTLQAESEELYYKYVYPHKEFFLMTGVSSTDESTDIVQTCMIVQTYIGITQKQWNITPIQGKKHKLNNILCTEIEM